ncbi:MAG: hypothetical protein HGJ97_11875 [Desulfosporosinus sp.]|nr:hypothetical protein [Desulfosporosinus sp.]
MSIREWCVQNGLKTTAYKYWVRKFNLMDRQATEGNTFAEVILLPETTNSTEATGSTSGISLSLGDFSIGISDGFNPITLTEFGEGSEKAMMQHMVSAHALSKQLPLRLILRIIPFFSSSSI